LAWAFEMTPEGVKKTSNLEEDAGSPSTGKMDILILIGIIAVLGMGVWQQLSLNVEDSRFSGKEAIDSEIYKELVGNTDNPEIHSVIPAQAGTSASLPETQEIQNNTIAVLPFSDLSQAGDQEYFSDGIAEEILNVLVRVEALQVTSRTSAFQFKGSQKGIPAIAKELKVRHVLEGSVRKAGDTLRITAQLIDAQNDKHLWSETYDRPLTTDNIFAIQDEISNAIVQALSISLKLEVVEKITVNKTTDNLNAYELYLKARPLFLARDDLDVADEYLIKAIELDEGFAQAWEMRAALQLLIYEYGFTVDNLSKQIPLAEKYALKALSINPKSALAKSSLANKTSTNIDGTDNFSAEVIHLYNESIEIDPNNATTYNWRGLTYSSFGMLDQAKKDFQRCLELEPLYSACYSNVSSSAFMQDTEYAEEIMNKGLDKDIINIQYLNLSWLAKYRKESLFKIVINQRENLANWRRADELYQAYLNPEQNHRQLIDDILAFHKRNNQNDSISVPLRIILVPIGAFELDPDAASMWGFGHHTYRQSDEFKNYVKRSGIYQYWLEMGFPPQCKPLGADDFECE
jgi:TolB-like protein/Tfp pilus assembly protein PilF